MALLPDRGDPGITLAGMLILAALGAFVWKAAPLESARPESERPEVFLQADEQAPARLWQDPLSTAYLYRLEHGAGVERAKTPLPVELRDALQNIDTEAASERQERLLVLGVMLSPGPYAELEERRRRRRYAVLAGVGESGFVPRDAEHLGIFSLPSLAHGDGGSGADLGGALSLGPTATTAAQEWAVPYEWYDFDGPDCRVRRGVRSLVLLWLDEGHFGARPFDQLQRLLDSLLPKALGEDRRQIDLTLLGPARSGTLQAMVAQHAEASSDLRENSGLGELRILSPAATVHDEYLGPDMGKFRRAFPALSKPAPNTTALSFLRTIRSDRDLMGLLVNELGKRDFEPSRDHLVLISEWDTYFGRLLPEQFKAAFEDRYRAVESRPPDQIRWFTYQRGIDGIVPGNSPRTEAGASSEGAKETVRRPTGTGQFDYLRRLAAEIGAQDRQWRLQTGRGVRAVAVLGSDVFDKLLILRALRGQLPGAVWLTTDLDVQFLHPSEFTAARNLIVASSFGLALAPPLQSHTPPFRDSYQSASFLATRLALDPEVARWLTLDPTDGSADYQSQLNAAIQPLVFELGRDRAVPMAKESSAWVSVHPEPAPSFAQPVAWAMFAIAVLGILAVNQLLPRSGRQVFAAILLLVLVGLFSWLLLSSGGGGEPFDWTASLSIWPTEFIRLVTLFFALLFVGLVIRRLRENGLAVKAQWLDGEIPPDLEPPSLATILWGLRLKRIRVRTWAVGGGLLVAAMIGMMLSNRLLPLGLESRLWFLALAWALVISLWWSFIYGKFRPEVQVLSINQWVPYTPPGDPEGIWKEYERYGATEQRTLRALSYMLLYVAFASVLIALLGMPAAPCRGDLACTLDRVMIGLCVMAMLFLLFLVVDAIRLCISWIELMRKSGLEWAPGARAQCEQSFRLPPKHCAAWVQIHMIGERTGEITRLIYYPMLVILLLLLSRSSYFDDWGLPLSLLLIVGLNFAIALAAAARLNSVARQARAEILEQLRREHLKLAVDYHSGAPEPSPQEVGEMIQQLEQLRMGAYVELWDQPAVRAVLFLIGGIGITLSEYLTLI